MLCDETCIWINTWRQLNKEATGSPSLQPPPSTPSRMESKWSLKHEIFSSGLVWVCCEDASARQPSVKWRLTWALLHLSGSSKDEWFWVVPKSDRFVLNGLRKKNSYEGMSYESERGSGGPFRPKVTPTTIKIPISFLWYGIPSLRKEEYPQPKPKLGA
jgi:hypothetical protein